MPPTPNHPRYRVENIKFSPAYKKKQQSILKKRRKSEKSLRTAFSFVFPLLAPCTGGGDKGGGEGFVEFATFIIFFVLLEKPKLFPP